MGDRSSRRWVGSTAPAWRGPGAPGSQGHQLFRKEQSCLSSGFHTLDCVHRSGKNLQRRMIPASRFRMGPGFCRSNRLTGVADAAEPQTSLEGPLEAVATGLLVFPSGFGPMVCKAPPCFYLTQASKGRGFSPFCAGAEKGDAREKPCIPGAILVVAAGTK